jgi:serine/threonine protein kinase
LNSCCRLVYRDIKPDNIGFDVRGDVKLFDFGLMANLRPELRREDDMYSLTGRTGSFPYMAPVSFEGLACMLFRSCVTHIFVIRRWLNAVIIIAAQMSFRLVSCCGKFFLSKMRLGEL